MTRENKIAALLRELLLATTAQRRAALEHALDLLQVRGTVSHGQYAGYDYREQTWVRA